MYFKNVVCRLTALYVRIVHTYRDHFLALIRGLEILNFSPHCKIPSRCTYLCLYMKVCKWCYLIYRINRPRRFEQKKSLKRLNMLCKLQYHVLIHKINFLTWILCKDSREGSSQSHVGSNFIVLFFLKCKLEHFRPNFMNLVPGVFEILYILFM